MKIKDLLKNQNLASVDTLAAEVILAFVLKKNREYLYTHFHDYIDKKFVTEFFKLMKQYLEGKPVSYITNQKEFFGLSFYVDERVLIPRPETELIVETVIDLISSDSRFRCKKMFNILDIGTGSGNIAIALAFNVPNVHIVASDFSKEALEVAKINVNNYNLKNKIKLIYSDLLENILEKKFDIIVANLPYIGLNKNNFISKETKDFEPHIALFGGDDGLALYRRLFKQLVAKKNFTKYLLGEIGFLHGKDIRKLIVKYFGDVDYKILPDLAGMDRYFIINFNNNALC
jgi:release factor glutamine methyltransferase